MPTIAPTALETRTMTTAPLEVRASDAGPGVLVGHSPVWDRHSEDLGGFVEVVRKGATETSIGSDDIRALIDHDSSKVLGRNRSGTLDLEEDDTGLRFEIDLPDTATARELVTLVERGDITGSSFAFRVLPDGQQWTFTDDDRPLRVLRSLKLYDVSVVTYPAYPDSNDTALRHAFGSLVSEQRSIGDVMAAASAGNLSDLIKRANDQDPPESDQGEPESDPARLDLVVAERQLELARLKR